LYTKQFLLNQTIASFQLCCKTNSNSQADAFILQSVTWRHVHSCITQQQGLKAGFQKTWHSEKHGRFGKTEIQL